MKEAFDSPLTPTTAQERECDAMAARGEDLRAAVAWRWYQGHGCTLSAVSSVPESALEAFVTTGKISEHHRRLLEAAS